MRKALFWIALATFLGGGVTALVLQRKAPQTPSISSINMANSQDVAPSNQTNTAASELAQPSPTPTPTNQNGAVPPQPASAVAFPLAGFASRITKKPFGIHIIPATSPVQPERFSGYHTGADAETTADEAAIDIPVFSITDGKIVLKRTMSGYGGVVMIEHVVSGETVTALYGHMRLSSISKSVGDAVQKGEQIAVLGTGFSAETDGERKHLHFGLRQGRSTGSRGYVSSEAQLAQWVDPVRWFQEHGL